jgi:hypothetical protein
MGLGGNPMQVIHICVLCEKEIEPYLASVNRFDIDETRSADICSGCIRKSVKLQQKNYAILFPTKTAKRYLKKSES